MGIYLILIVIITGLLLLLYMWKQAFLDQVLETSLYFEDFPASFGKVTIFFISDIHKRSITDVIINKARGKADIVVVGGDLAEGKVPFSRIESNLKKLKEIGPVYFVWGNNDYETDYHLLDATLLKYGVKILDNTSVLFESETGEKMCLLGIDYMDGERDRLDLAIQDADEGAFRILISHTPAILKQIEPDSNISLLLSGHTHGGQIRILGFGRYRKGRIAKKGSTTYLVSNGYGTSLVPLRLGAKPETHLITLLPKEKDKK
ncbi:putative MPP superfamily phosphohydrolase [Peribacillus deserti]|uniref:MPP superfamily phosphohydrolase n=1 Tax=Peribacillus deserti TaxID=673318 RepID=A0ABS2QPR6_9BACI|nr:metallophosphoesterase [Peribacillus deserti]MBM7694724.1 putative MPP superfamily phosphohydrolase [Peribacillus deserti]